jgi:hypothetical protein
VVRSGLRTNAAGELVIPDVSIPDTAAPTATFYAQIWIADPQAPQGLAASNAISVNVP